MNLKEQLRMAQVKRYPICFTNRDQSVAEHSFGVMLITMELCKYIDDREVMDCALAYALTHDQDEVFTGDIPSPFKRELRAKCPANCPAVTEHSDPRCPVPAVVKAIVKLADNLEAIHYLNEYGGSRFAGEVLEDIYINFELQLKKCEAVLPWALLSAARELGQTV